MKSKLSKKLKIVIGFGVAQLIFYLPNIYPVSVLSLIVVGTVASAFIILLSLLANRNKIAYFIMFGFHALQALSFGFPSFYIAWNPFWAGSSAHSFMMEEDFI